MRRFARAGPGADAARDGGDDTAAGSVEGFALMDDIYIRAVSFRWPWRGASLHMTSQPPGLRIGSDDQYLGSVNGWQAHTPSEAEGVWQTQGS